MRQDFHCPHRWSRRDPLWCGWPVIKRSMRPVLELRTGAILVFAHGGLQHSWRQIEEGTDVALSHLRAIRPACRLRQQARASTTSMPLSEGRMVAFMPDRIRTLGPLSTTNARLSLRTNRDGAIRRDARSVWLSDTMPSTVPDPSSRLRMHRGWNGGPI
jgi:hypothetical protein